MLRNLLVSFLLTLPLLTASQVDEPIALTGAGPSAFVENVNAITGDLVEVVDIMEFKGSIPYKVQETITRFNSTGFKMDEQAIVKKHRNNRVDCTYKNPGRLKAILSPEGRGLDWGEFTLNMELDQNAGLTNQGLGVSSGQTHPKNIKAFVQKYSDKALITGGDGSRKVFKRMLVPTKDDSAQYDFHYEVRPDCGVIKRRWDDQRIFECWAGGEKVWGFFAKAWANSTSDQGYRKYFSDDGRVTQMETTSFWDGKKKSFDPSQKWYPTKVLSHNSCPINYQWKNKEGYKYAFLTSKSLPDGRATRYKYYGVNADKVDRHSKNRIKSIESRVKEGAKGSREKFLNRYKFEYDSENPCGLLSTWVIDGNGYYRRFKYTSEEYLHSKYWYTTAGDKSKYAVKETFKWGKKGDAKGCLLKDTFTNSNKKILKETSFKYDKSGNVVDLQVQGAITYPNADNQHHTYSTYSTDGYNLLTSQTVGAKTTQYRYKKATNLLTAKFTVTSEGIVERNFYFYNEQSALIGEINDDGTTEDPDCLEGVTTRLVKRIKTLPNGTPKEIVEGYLDLDSGKEQQLKRIVYKTTVEGWIEKEEVYDAEDNYCYTIEKEYDNCGNVLWKTDAEGNKVSHTYLESGACVKTIPSRRKTEILYDYDCADRLLSETTQEGGKAYVNTYEYDAMGNRTVMRDMYGNVTRIKYDAFGRPVEVKMPAIETPEGPVVPITKKEYDFFGNVTLDTDANGFATLKTYNLFGKPFAIHYPDGSYEELRYNIDGTLKWHRFRSGSRIVYTYDDLGRVTKERTLLPDGKLHSEEISEYDRLHVRRKIDAEGVVTEFDYDYAGRLICQKKEDQCVEFGYDSLGRKILTKTWFGDDFTAEYEILNNLDRVVEERTEDSKGNIHRQVFYRYDEVGNRTHVIIGDSVTKTIYDVLKRPVEITSPEGYVTHIEYQSVRNSLGQSVLQKITTEPSGTLTFETYDSRGIVVDIEKVSAMGEILSKTHLFYDCVGNLIERNDDALAKGELLHTSVVRWQYNSMNQPVLLIEAPGTDLQRTTHTTYTLFGEKENVCKPDGTTLHFEYNGLGLVSKHYSSNALQNVSYTYYYDRKQRLIRTEDLYQDQSTVRTYDALDNLVEEKLANGTTVLAEYDPLGRLKKIDFGSDKIVEYLYDAAFLREVSCLGLTYRYDEYDLSGNVLKRTLPSSAGTVEHTYDLEGRVTSIVHPAWSETNICYDLNGNLIAKQLSIDGELINCSYGYDELDQLTEEEGVATHSYVYDSLHNRLSKDATAYQNNSLNEITSVGDELFAYDAFGNLIRRGKTHYTYDALDRLVAVKTPSQTVTYTYDAFGRRLSRSTDEQTILYHYHGDHEVGSSQGDFRFLGNGLGAEIGATVVMTHQGQSSIPIHDQTGNVRALLSTDGTLCATYNYSAYGETDPSTHSNQWLFASKRYDPETNLYSFGLRYYAPDLGRWITTDPKSYQEGPNLYAYVANRPLTLIDEFGAFAVETDNYRYRNSKSISCYEQCAKAIIVGLSENFDSTKSYLENYRGSGCYDLGYHENPDLGIGFVNGINTSYDECREHAEMLSAYGNGYNIRFVYNQTHGFILDLFECILGRLGFTTDPVNQLHKMWDNFFDSASEDGRFVMFCHSQGAIHVKNALMSYPEERRKRIDVEAFCPGGYIDQSTCGNVQHYRGHWWRDLVPVTDILGMFRNRLSTAVLSSSTDACLFDHSFSSPTYQDLILSILTKVLSIGGEF
jgi:RHS repeat-associated protein